MPELPEVETIKRELERTVSGQTIKAIKIYKPKLFFGKPSQIIGAKIVKVFRRAKVIFFYLDNQQVIMVHLKMTGRFLWRPEKTDWVKQEKPHLVISLTKGKLNYYDLRQFGWLKVVDQKTSQIEQEKFGPEPFSSSFSLKYLQNVFSRSRRPIKIILMDQSKISGIGNIYANESLFEAKLNPLKPAKELNNQEIKLLKKAIIKVLKSAIRYQGSTASDKHYRQLNGNFGQYQRHFKVYQREGEKCYHCGHLIKKIKIANRGTFFCPFCQKL